MAALLAATTFAASVKARRAGEGETEAQHVHVVLPLGGPPIHGVLPSGKAVYSAGRHHARLRIVARRVALPRAVLIVRIDGLRVGLVRLGVLGNGMLVLRSREGDAVPRITEDSTIELRDRETGRVVLSNALPAQGIPRAGLLLRVPWSGAPAEEGLAAA
jgi:hypothetical protein